MCAGSGQWNAAQVTVLPQAALPFESKLIPLHSLLRVVGCEPTC